MNEKSLLKLALIISLVGLVLLFVISKNIEINDTTIEKITNEEIEGDVVIKGIVKEITERSGTTFIIITQQSEIEVIVFSNDVNLSKGDNVEIIGSVSEYQNQKEIIADKIEII